MGMERSIAVILSSRPGERVMLGLWRRHRTPAFDARDKAKARLMAPVLVQTYDRLRDEGVQGRFAWLLQALEPVRLTEPVILFDRADDVSFANGPGQALLPMLREDKRGTFVSGCPSLPAMIEAAKVRQPARFAIGSRGWTVHAVPIPKAFGEGTLIYFASDNPDADPLERLAKLGLTRREIEVVDATAMGLSNKEIARKLGISYFTVQDHMKAIYRKLNVNNRVGLTNFTLGRH
jgi:DNA-binding CsgD family transcriptional regulator